MSITYQNAIPSWAGTAPAASASYTPASAGDTLLFLAATAITNAGLGITGANSLLQYNNTAASWTTALLDILSCSAGAQTFTLTASAAYYCYGIIGVEYSGASSVSNAATTENDSPGAGAGAIVGTSVVVPTGNTLVALCWDITGNGTIAAQNGTQRSAAAFGPYYCVSDFAGAGAAIQPKFTASVGTDTFIVQQVILGTAGSSSRSPTVGSALFSGAAGNLGLRLSPNVA